MTIGEGAGKGIKPSGNINPGIRINTSHVGVGGQSTPELWWNRAQYGAQYASTRVIRAISSANAQAEAQLRDAREIEERRRKLEQEAQAQGQTPQSVAGHIHAAHRQQVIAYQSALKKKIAYQMALEKQAREEQAREARQAQSRLGRQVQDQERLARQAQSRQVQDLERLEDQIDQQIEHNFKQGFEDALPRGWKVRWK